MKSILFIFLLSLVACSTVPNSVQQQAEDTINSSTIPPPYIVDTLPLVMPRNYVFVSDEEISLEAGILGDLDGYEVACYSCWKDKPYTLPDGEKREGIVCWLNKYKPQKETKEVGKGSIYKVSNQEWLVVHTALGGVRLKKIRRKY